MIRTTGLDQSVLHVNDVERSTRFYTEILGMPEYTEDKGRISSCTPFSRVLPSPDRCIYFRDPDGYRLQLIVCESP
jgi:Glyoxalase/Bleomycin resistance protein/Dioxygenase superfamily